MEKITRRPPQKLYNAAWAVLLTLAGLFVLLGTVCFFSAWWYVRVYGRTGFDSVIFTLTNSLNGVDRDLIWNYLLGGLLPALAVTGAVIALFVLLRKKREPLRYGAAALSVAVSLGLLIHAAYNVEFVSWIRARNQLSELYETEYVDPMQTQITFPEQKRNLVYIVLESMETSYLSQDQGGGLPYNLIGELEGLAWENVNFSHNEGVGGFREVPGASWTIGALVGHTAGVPLKVPDGIADWQNGYGKDGTFLPGLNTLFNVLDREGYNQALMVGSDVSFGGRDAYYGSHGVEDIYDLVTAWKSGIVPYGYWNDFWGMEDKYLFDYARRQLTELSQREEPFAFTLLTVDTHHIGGFTCTECDDTYEESYANAIACSSRQVAEFVSWLSDQSFYENTTVIITGDHCSMDKGWFDRNVDGSYERHVYNCFLNAAAEPFQEKNRDFCALDMFPTTLAAMGCTIEGERLGLGTNLFSNVPTLIERMGYLPFCAELSKSSEFYTQFYGET